MTRIIEFPDFPGLTAGLRRELVKRSRQLHVPQGDEVFPSGGQVDALLILLSGTLRVERPAETGRKIILYRVRAGENCILTATCLLAEGRSAATGIAETDLELLSVSKAALDYLMSRSPEFRGLIFQSYSKRITESMQEVEEVAFHRIDTRLSRRLIELAGDETQIAATQAQIATELGTAREVVSRQLGEFQRSGWVEVGRGIVRLLDKNALRKLAHS